VEGFKTHGEDFVVADSLDAFVEGMGGCSRGALLDFSLTADGHATVPACALPSRHIERFKLAKTESSDEAGRFIWRNFSGGTASKDGT